jgi:glycosyltransferase involved in cell wall biosynthesis
MITTKAPTIGYSVLVPVFCEEESLSELTLRIAAMFADLGHADDFEIVYVDDGSTDQTAEVVQRLAREHSFVQFVRLRRNHGKSLALSAGLLHVRGRRIITIDADLQDHPEDIPKLLAKLDSGYDLVNGWRVNRSDTNTRRRGSRLFNWTVRHSTQLDLHDMNCGLKAFTFEAARALWLYGQYHRYLPLQAHIAGFKVTEVPVQSSPRRYGYSKFPTFRYEGAFDLMSLLFLHRYGLNPLHFFGKLAVLITVPSGFAIAYFIASQVLYWFGLGEPVLNRPLLTFSLVAFLIGLLIFLTGFVCDFILHHQIRDRMQQIVTMAVVEAVDDDQQVCNEKAHGAEVR